MVVSGVKYFSKSISLFIASRAYNIVLLMIAMYLAAIFFFSPEQNFLIELKNPELHYLILASCLSLSAGFLINNFYDNEKDILTKPLRSSISGISTRKQKLETYLVLNVIALVIALISSWRVFLFFFCYQFLLWFYSHKINKVAIANNLLYTVLVCFPFLALFIFYKNFNGIIFLHGTVIFLLILISDILKDLYSVTADAIYDYETLPTIYSEKTTKWIVSGLLITTISCNYYFISTNIHSQNLLIYFHLLSALTNLITIVPLWMNLERWMYHSLSWGLKFLILAGVFSITFLKLNLLEIKSILGL